MEHRVPREVVDSPFLVLIHCTDVALHEQGLDQATPCACVTSGTA